MERSSICLGMMVKNESHVIRRVLSSAKPHIDSWCIIDTGSDDGTQEIIREELEGIPGELHEREWTGHFGNHRTEVFELASKHADYVLMLDADDVLFTAPEFTWGQLGSKGYMVKISMGGTTWDRLALLRSDKPWKYYGPIHEWAKCNEPGPLPLIGGAHIMAMPDGRRRLDEPVEKYERDVETLKAEIEKDPKSTRNWFYLAQSHRDAHQNEEAIEIYRKRAGMGGWPEEVWYSLYQIGVLHEKLGNPKEAISAYIEAYEARPGRAEPLCAAASLARREKRYGLAWMFGLCATATPMPNDILFMNMEVYSWRCLNEYAIAAYWVGRYREGQVACTKLLQIAPAWAKPQIQKNLEFCNEKLAPVRRQVGDPSGKPGKKILITGAGRSGTGYMSKVLTNAGILCGHEIVCGPYTEDFQWGEYDAESSWLAVPWLSTISDDVYVVHLVRNFLDCARSWAGVGQFDNNPHPNHGPYIDAVARYAPGIMKIPDRLGRIAAYWTVWNEAINGICHERLLIDKVDLETLKEMLRRAEVEVDPADLEKAYESTPRDVNARKREDDLTLEDFQKATPPKIWTRLCRLCDRYKIPI